VQRPDAELRTDRPEDPSMQTGSIRHGRGWAALATVLVTAMGCASVPAPRGTISQAELTIEQAQQAGAQEHAPLDLYQAREKLAAARAAAEQNDNERATRIAELALADAQLAEARARTQKARQTEAEVRTSLETLRAETAMRSSQTVR
jgi:hypothetical protein